MDRKGSRPPPARSAGSITGPASTIRAHRVTNSVDLNVCRRTRRPDWRASSTKARGRAPLDTSHDCPFRFDIVVAFQVRWTAPDPGASTDLFHTGIRPLDRVVDQREGHQETPFRIRTTATDSLLLFTVAEPIGTIIGFYAYRMVRRENSPHATSETTAKISSLRLLLKSNTRISDSISF